jgi:hypothetical protein
VPKASPIRTTFNAGELTPLMDGRVDIAKYNNGCKTLQNFIPSVQGPAVRRAGTRFVAETKTSANKSWLIAFEFNVNQVFVLEFGDKYIRFFANHGVLETSGVAAYDSGTSYLLGDLCVSGGIVYYCIASTTGNAPPNTTYWYSQAVPTDGSGNQSIYEIPSPYAVADLTDSNGILTLDYVQSGDVIYITHGSYPVYKLSRYANLRWTMQPVAFANGPFQDQNINRSINVYASATSGTVTLTANSGIFSPNMVGCYFYLEPADLSQILPWTAGQEFTANPLNSYRQSDGKTYICATNGTPTSGKVWRTGGDKPIHTYGTECDGGRNSINGTNVEREGLDWTYVDSGYGYVKITGYTSSTSVTASVQGNWNLPSGVVGSGNATFRWAWPAFAPPETKGSTFLNNNPLYAAGYPTNTTFFRERLAFAMNQQVYFSVASDFENFARYDDSGQVVADRAIIVQIASDQANTIQWMTPNQALLIGTSGASFACQENSTNDVFAPGNVKIEQQTADGSSAVFPASVGFSNLFIQRSGRKLIEQSYNFQQNGYVTSDMTVLAEHITIGGITQIMWHQDPYVALWCTRADGTLLCFTFNKEQDVTGWASHPMTNGIVESLCVVSAPDLSRDDLWLIVNRTVNGVTKRYVEYLSSEYKTGDTLSLKSYVDCSATYNGTATTTITGLGYLEGQTVQVLADGSTHPNCVVTGGTITLQRSASIVQVGLPYSSVLTTNRIEAGAADGTAQGKTKRINKCVIRFFNTLGGNAGPDTSTLDEIEFRSPHDPMDQPPAIFTGDKLMEWPDGYNFDGYITVVQSQPLPMTIVAIMPQLHTFDR